MSLLKYAVRRTAFAFVSAFLVVTATFLILRTAPNTDLGALISGMERGGASPAEIDAAVREYRLRRGLTGSLFDQYVRFVVGAATFDLGFSQSFRAPVGELLADATPRTLGYIVPGVVMAYVLGIAGGLASAYTNKVTDWSLRLSSYALLGVTTIVLSVAAVTVLESEVSWLSNPIWIGTPFMSRGNPYLAGTEPWRNVGLKFLLPATIIAAGLLAGLVRHTRNNALAYRGSETSKMLEAKGASNLVRARHALKNAALPLLSVSFAELMSVLALGAFVVETIFHIPGIAAYTMIGVYTRDFALVVGATVVFAIIGIAGSLIQDILYGYLDPTVREN